jgi:hypothetical protein
MSDISLIYNIKTKISHLFHPRRGGAKKRRSKGKCHIGGDRRKITNCELQGRKCHVGGDKMETGCVGFYVLKWVDKMEKYSRNEVSGYMITL